MRQLCHRLKLFIRSQLYKILIIILCCISFPFRFILNKKNIWLILERGYDAQDNAWHFFKYIKKYHPEINVYFAIVKSSPDYHTNLSAYKADIVEYGSIKYFILLFCSSYVISTHLQTYAYFKSIYSWLSHSIFDTKAKKVFLQHGIIHNFFPSFEYPKLSIHLFISGAYNEYSLFTSLFRYPDSIVKYTGLARFDNLFNYNKKKQVLIMPTWRSKYAGYTSSEFAKTDFYIAYKQILTDTRLHTALYNSGYELIFYNHYEFQKFNSLFERLCSERVTLIRFGEKKVQDLLKDASLLVTDYSSVYYDFFYMKKPVLFFKLNKTEFEASQYGVDYDNPHDFGYVTLTSTATINKIIDLIECECKFEPRFINWHNSIFPIYDNNNCQRIYDSIIKL